MLADATGLAERIKKAALDAQRASRPVNVYFGEVRSKYPLRIVLEQKAELGEKQLVLARNVTDFITWIEGKKTIVKNGLEAGDKVILVRQQEGKKYIVVDRIGVM